MAWVLTPSLAALPDWFWSGVVGGLCLALIIGLGKLLLRVLANRLSKAEKELLAKILRVQGYWIQTDLSSSTKGQKIVIVGREKLWDPDDPRVSDYWLAALESLYARGWLEPTSKDVYRLRPHAANIARRAGWDKQS